MENIGTSFDDVRRFNKNSVVDSIGGSYDPANLNIDMNKINERKETVEPSFIQDIILGVNFDDIDSDDFESDDFGNDHCDFEDDNEQVVSSLIDKISNETEEDYNEEQVEKVLIDKYSNQEDDRQYPSEEMVHIDRVVKEEPLVEEQPFTKEETVTEDKPVLEKPIIKERPSVREESKNLEVRSDLKNGTHSLPGFDSYMLSNETSKTNLINIDFDRLNGKPSVLSLINNVCEQTKPSIYLEVVGDNVRIEIQASSPADAINQFRDKCTTEMLTSLTSYVSIIYRENIDNYSNTLGINVNSDVDINNRTTFTPNRVSFGNAIKLTFYRYGLAYLLN